MLVTAHYDSLAQVRKPYTGLDQIIAEAVRQGIDESEARRYRRSFRRSARKVRWIMKPPPRRRSRPGVTDDGSGTAGVMELARVMSGYQFDKTIVFIAFAGEEVGLSGSQVYATQAKQDGMRIEAVLNNDIIGSDVSRQRAIGDECLRVFSASPDDSRAARIGALYETDRGAYVPSMQVEMVFRGDRFLRGGDHRPFANQGYRGGAADQREREFREPAHRHRHIREYLGSLCDARGSHECRGAGELGSGSGASG